MTITAFITRKRLNDFARDHPDTRTALEHWYRNMKRRNFASLAEVHTVFPTADKVGNLTVFNIGGNKVRLLLLYTTIGIKCISCRIDPWGI